MWKKRKTFGGVKRKIEKEFQQIKNYQQNKTITKSSFTEDETIISQVLLQSTSNEGSALKKSCIDIESANLINEKIVSQALLRSTSNEGSALKKSCINIDSANLTEPPDFDHDTCSLCSSASSSNEEDDFSKNLLFRRQIKEWAIEGNISQKNLSRLAAVINSRFPGILPRDARTIISTVKQIHVKTIEQGEYCYNGLTKSLQKALENWADVPNKVKLNFNFDGLPIFKSSNKEFWPILCNIFERPDIKPFVIGIYFGVGKPKDLDDYLDDFIKEMGSLIAEGIYIEKLNKKVLIEIRCFICDSPARAYIKGVCSFNAKHGCLKCVTVGEYSHLSHTVTFHEINCRPRTNQEFRDKKYGPHHKKDSPLLKLPVDMIQDFPVADSLHLIDLGIVKRLLVGWRNGNFGKYTTKWSAKDTETVSRFLDKRKLPFEIHRSVRGLDCLSHWKASEYRSFLFYLSIVILPDVLKQDAFSHFLTLFCGITICSSKNYSNFLPLAKQLLTHFVEHYKDFYGSDYITSNVHNLVHLTDEVLRFGPLHTFSAYPFENKLYLIKRMLRHGNRPLAQVAKRLNEDSALDMSKNRENQNDTYVEPFVTTNGKKLNILHFKHFRISLKPQDKYFLCNNNAILEFKKIETVGSNEIKITGYKITGLIDVFEEPMKSSYLNIFKAKLNTARWTEMTVSPKDIKTKLVCTAHQNYLYFIPLLHTV